MRGSIIFCNFAPQKAQMAELVDALVSNTNTFGCTGSSPVLGTKHNPKPLKKNGLGFFICLF